MSLRVLVTGAGGLIGRELLPVLRCAYGEVFALGRSAADLPDYHRCDLADPEAARPALERILPGAVVHLAGGTAPDRHELYRSNVLSTVHLLEAAARLEPPPYCVVFGSAAEYAEAAALIDEAAPLEPRSAYGRAKLAQTTLAEGIGRARGIPLTILRPFNLVSPRLPPSTALGNMRRQLLASGGPVRSVRCGRLDVVRDFVPLAIVVEAVRRLLATPAPGRTINVCSGVGIELGELLAAMARRLGVEVQIVEDASLAALPAASRVVGDPSALRDRLGLSVAPTAETLAEVLLG